MHRPWRQPEAALHFQDVLAKPLGREAVLAGVVAQAREVELSDAGRVDQDVDRQIAIPRPGEFVDEVTDGPKRSALLVLLPVCQRTAQFVHQPGLGTLPQHIGDGFASALPGRRRRRTAPPSKAGFREVKESVHNFLATSMPRQMHPREAAAANTPPSQCSSVPLDAANAARKTARQMRPNVVLASADIIAGEAHATHPKEMKPRPPQPNWPAVLTDWCVIKALVGAGWPPLFDKAPEWQAVFVSEVSDYVRFRVLVLREAQAETRLIEAAEATYERIGGAAYCAARDTFECARSTYYVAYARARRQAVGNFPFDSEKSRNLRAQLQHCEMELAALRRRAQPAARLAQRESAETFWNAIAVCRVPDDFFADVHPDSVLAKIPFRYATWWGLFVGWLRHTLWRSNPSYSHLMEELPRLRAEAARPSQILVLSAVVQEWREANGERLGLLKDVHFPVLEQRSFQKHRMVEQWFEQRAPGYRSDPAVREAAAQRLYSRMECVPPERPQLYWRN